MKKEENRKIDEKIAIADFECPLYIKKTENAKFTFPVPLPRIEATGFEPTTSASRTQRSTKLSHASLIAKNIIVAFKVFVNLKIIFVNDFKEPTYTLEKEFLPEVWHERISAFYRLCV